LNADLARGLAIAAAAGLFLAFAGAFETGQAPIAVRLAYWLGLMLGGAVFGQACAAWLFAQPRLVGRTRLLAVLLVLMIGAPYTLVVWVASALAFHAPLRPGGLLGYAVPVLAVSAVMTAINILADRRPRETHATAEASPPKFLARLPLKLRGAEIFAVEAEDHYLRIHTDRGSDLILMRLSDAVGELEGLEGAQTHRSWWVAKDAVIGAERGDGRATLTLKGAIQAPVSRTYARALRREGWY
jgi:DNA-binding LytR/AlgR family response regulator